MPEVFARRAVVNGIPAQSTIFSPASAADMTTAQLKLTAALPEGARETANRLSARFHLDPIGWFRSADDARLLPAIKCGTKHAWRSGTNGRRGSRCRETASARARAEGSARGTSLR
jgi:hypothetical protein